MSAHALTPGCGKDVCRGCPACNTRECSACRLVDASLTTDCCGQEVTATAHGKICEGKLDYREGKWINAPNPTQQELDKIRSINRRANLGGHAGAY